MQTKRLCVLIHTRIKGGVAPLYMFKPSIELFYWPLFILDTFCYLCFKFVFIILSSLFLATL